MIEYLKNYSINKGEVMLQDKNINIENEKFPSAEEFANLSDLFKVFGDLTRLKIMKHLEARPLYVSELAEKLEMSLSAISHQLRILRGAKLVKGIKQGKEVLYSLDDDHVTQIMNIGFTHVSE